MCLILFAYQSHPNYHLILAANRDEFYQRPSKQAAFWQDKPYILAGFDLEGLGTWMGITKIGRFSAVTNYRAPHLTMKDAHSRGGLVKNYLCGKEIPNVYLQNLTKERHLYNPFNLLVGDITGLYYYSNIDNNAKKIKPGIYGLCNHLLDTPWPKVIKGKQRLTNYVSTHTNCQPLDLLDILSDNQQASDNELPATGVSLEWERLLSSIFIKESTYGTRSSTVLLIDKNNTVTFTERTFSPDMNTHHDINYQFSVAL